MRLRDPALQRLGRSGPWLLASVAAVVTTAATTSASAQTTPDPNAPPAPGTPYGQPMDAGGLAPPPPMSSGTSPPSSPTEQQLDTAKKEDAGRGLSWVWLNVEGGYEHVGLQTFNANTQTFTAGFVPSTADGGVIGPGLGVRLLFLTIGVRGRLGFFDNFQLFSVGPEIGFHIPLGNLEPHLEIGGGYAAMGSFKGTVSGADDAIHVRGFDARIGAGLDYYITPVLSVGAGASWEFLGLTRPGVDAATINRLGTETTVTTAQADALAVNGTSYGSAISVTALVGLHF
jgi:hypothetical protein